MKLKELEDDKAVRELMACWCKSNEQEKNAAIASAKAKISQLESSMDASTGKIVQFWAGNSVWITTKNLVSCSLLC